MARYTQGRYTFSNNYTARQKMIKQQALLPTTAKPVIDLTTGIQYPSLKEAALLSGINETIVWKCCKEREGYEEYKGHKFRYI